MISKQGDNLVFLLGVPRSGTTLLSVMLDGHSMLRCPPEPWLMLALESVGRVSARSPADAPVLYRALKDFCDPATAIVAARQYATVAYNQVLNASGKQILVDKTPRYYLILSYLTEVFPRAKFVILWRNPLDIAASMRTTWLVDIAANFAAGEDHLTCIDLVVGLRRLLDFSREHADRVHTLRYEQLVRQPQKTFNALLNWLDLPIQKLAGFQLGGGDFDKGDIGDKKILSTSAPHKNSIGRWSDTFSAQESAGILHSIGPHIFSAMGYDDALNAARGDGIAVADPAYSNAYANRLEQSLLKRNAEYQSVETFNDLTRQERRLHQALLGTSLLASQPVPVDLVASFREASVAVDRLSTGLAEKVAKVDHLEREGTASAARLDEARNLARQQLDHAGARETEWTARFTTQGHELEISRFQAIDLREQLHRAQVQLERLAADHSTQCESMLAVTRQLEDSRSELAATAAGLHEKVEQLELHQQRVDNLTQQLQQADASQVRSLEELAAIGLRADALSSELLDARNIIKRANRAPVNRRPWPYAVPDSPPLPATLPDGKPWPKISIVTPSLNQGCYIEQTILSVLGQNYPDLEYIIIDGGSTDETMSIIDRFRDRISYVVSEKDTGQSNAINKGFTRSTGELLTWLNSDDMLESGALIAMAMAFHTSGADMVAGVCTVHSEGAIVNRHVTACAPGLLPIEDLLDLDHCWLKGQFFHQPEVMFTRDLWNRAGGYIYEDLYYSMDYELWLRFAEQKARLHVIGKSVALFRVHSKQKTFGPENYLPELRSVREQFIRRNAIPVEHNGRTNGVESNTHLRVLFFNDLGDVGGAGIGHQRLAAGFAMAGHEVIPIAIRADLTRCTLSNETILQAIADRAPDIVFLGNIHAAQLDPTIIGLIARRWPTLQVLHDFYSLTGRCAYTGDCTQFISGCDEGCPTSGDYPMLPSSQISNAWKTKHDVMTGENPPILAAVSEWAESVAQRRFTMALPQQKPQVVSIRSGVPTDVFRPRDKSTCRDVLDLPQNRFIVLFSSSNLADERKGLNHLIAALEMLKLPDLLAVCIGHQDVGLDSVQFDTLSMGYIDDPNSLAMLYSAADLFVGPSLVETFGQVFIEAAACGTPSVGYASAGGVADAVANGISGLLSPAQDPIELARQIRQLHDAPELRADMGTWGRLWVENEFSFHSTYQRTFAQLNKIGLLEKLHVPPKVSFLPDHRAVPEIIYLDPPAPIPTTADLLAIADARIGMVEAERTALQIESQCRLDELEAELESQKVKADSRFQELQSEHNATQAQNQSRMSQLETERDSLREASHIQLTDLRAERDSLRVHLHNVTHTRLWRIVGAMYPMYQKTLGSTSIPHLAKWPVQAMGQWLSQRNGQD